MSCTTCVDPGTYGRRADPRGEYVKRYCPELANFPVEYIYEPWLAPMNIQEKAKCIIGKDYPARIVIHEDVSPKNAKKMANIKTALIQKVKQVWFISVC